MNLIGHKHKLINYEWQSRGVETMRQASLMDVEFGEGRQNTSFLLQMGYEDSKELEGWSAMGQETMR